jgi:N-acyl homoserine lactone hydrolase
VEIHPEQPYGTRKPVYWWLLTSRRWTPPRPINAYVIEHAEGLILFDTGQDRASVTDDSYFPGGFTGYLYDRLARFHIEEEDTLTAQLATLGYAPADVDTAILSHLHEDHIGGLPSWGVQTCWSRRPSGSSSRGSAQSSGGSFASTSRSRDCSGHTAGSMSLLIRRRERSPLLLVGDLTYGAELLLRGQVPGVGARRQLVETTGKVLALKQTMPDLVVLPAHDPTAAQRLLES